MTQQAKTKQQLGKIKTMPAGTKLERHPLSALFPDAPEDQAENLRNSLRTHGQLNPIVLWGGKIIDGWGRYSQLTGLNQSLLVADYTGDDPVGFVYAQNYCRRSMTKQQRLMVTAKLTNLKQGKPKEGAKQVNLTLSYKQAEELTGFSESTIKKAKKILDSKNSDLIQGVESEKISVDMGSMLVDKPKDQIEAVLNSKNPKKTFKELPPSSDEAQPEPEDVDTASEENAAKGQSEPAPKKDGADALFAYVQDECKKLPDAQQERFRDLMREFLAQVAPNEPKPGVQEVPEEADDDFDDSDMIEDD